MRIIQELDQEICILRKDNGEQLTIVPGEEYEVDEETGAYLLRLKAYGEDEEGNQVLLTHFEIVE